MHFIKLVRFLLDRGALTNKVSLWCQTLCLLLSVVLSECFIVHLKRYENASNGLLWLLWVAVWPRRYWGQLGCNWSTVSRKLFRPLQQPAEKTSAASDRHWQQVGASICRSRCLGPQPTGSCALWLFETAFPVPSRCWMPSRRGSGCSSPEGTLNGLRKTGGKWCSPMISISSWDLATKVLEFGANQRRDTTCLLEESRQASSFSACLVMYLCMRS